LPTPNCKRNATSITLTRSSGSLEFQGFIKSYRNHAIIIIKNSKSLTINLSIQPGFVYTAIERCSSMAGCHRVRVHSIAPESSEESLRDFFSFCGDIRLIQLYPGGDGTPGEAIILFETESGASTAVLLDNAVVDGARIRVEAFPETPGPGSPNSQGRLAAASIPSASFMNDVIGESMNVANSIGKSAKHLDQQYEISNKLNTAASSIVSSAYAVDEKYHVSENASHSIL
jgi:hypothetical protein